MKPYIHQDWQFYLHQTKKFKNVLFYFNFVGPLKRSEITGLGMLCKLLRYANSTYKSNKAFNARQEELYDAFFSVNSRVNGDSHMMNFIFNFVNPKYFEDKNYNYRQIYKFIYSVFSPLLNKEGDGFDLKMFEICKKEFISNLKKIEEDKDLYLFLKLLDLDGGITSIGYLEDALLLDNKQCYQLLIDVLKRPLTITISGDISLANARKIVNPLFDFNFKPYRVKLSAVAPTKERYHSDQLSFIQSLLGMSITCQTVRKDEDLIPMILLNSVFGGDSFSKLFMTVREKHGLCYNISSNYDARRGIIYVIAGIDKDNKDLSIKLIKAELADLQKKPINTKLLKMAKARLIHDVKSNLDNQGMIISKLVEDKLLNDVVEVDDFIKEVKKVTPQDILNAAKKLDIKDIYFLAQGE